MPSGIFKQCHKCHGPKEASAAHYCEICAPIMARAVEITRSTKKRKWKLEISEADRKRRSEHMKRVRISPLKKGMAPGHKKLLKDGVPAEVMKQIEEEQKHIPDLKIPPPHKGESPMVAVQRELAARELAKRKLIHFVLRNNPKYMAGWFHIDLANRLDKFVEDIEKGLSPRLLLAVPPRHGKSKLTSEEFPAHVLGKHPDWEFIAASYGAELARDFSSKVQDRIRSEDYKLLFPDTQLKPGKESVDIWRIDKHGGTYAAIGVGGPATGRGAHILLIDDPLKNREEADSATVRQAVWNWYTSTAYTRLAPGAGIVLIQTRWHDDDLMGRLLSEMQVAEKQMAETGKWPEDADRWELVLYPAIATQDEPHRKKGEPLHAERYPSSALARIKRTIGPRDWSALYQQSPIPEEGAYFSKEHIVFYESAPDPAGMAIYGAADLAISKKEHADHTVFAVVGIDRSDDIWLLDLVRGRFDSMELLDTLFRLQRQWKVRMWGIEEGQITTALGPFLEKRLREERLYSLSVEPMKIKKQDKEARARPIQGRMRQGKVRLPKNAPFTEQLLKELMRFPNGSEDDCVDALAWIGQMMSLMNLQQAPTTKTPSWRDKLHRYAVSTNTAVGMMAA